MIKKVNQAKRFLLATAPKLRVIKDDILQILILKIARHADISLIEIQDILKQDYKIDIDILFLHYYINQLKSKELLTLNIKDGALFYQIRRKAIVLLKQIEAKNKIIFNELFMLLQNELPENLRFEASLCKEEILTDFVQSFSAETDRYYYELVIDKKLPPIRNFNKINCGVKGLNNDLLKGLNEAYTNVFIKENSELFSKLLSISLFWNSFVRFSSMDQSTKLEIMDEIEKTQLFADTNTIIAYCCHYHPEHDTTYEYYNSLIERLGINIYYSLETKDELFGYLGNIEKVVKSLQYFPERALQIAKDIKEPIIEGYFLEGYINWEIYSREFLRTVNSIFILYSEEMMSKSGVRESELYKMKLDILPNVKEFMIKDGKVAEHDAYLIALARLLRKNRSAGDWFKYTDWVSTHDKFFMTFDKDVGERTDPVSFLVKFIPYYFHPYYIIKFMDIKDLKDAYDLLYYTTYTLGKENNYDILKGTVKEIGEITSKDKFKDVLLQFTKETLSDSEVATWNK